MCPEFLWGGQEEWNHLEDNSVNNRTVLKWIIKEIGGGAWTRFIWLRIGTSCGQMFAHYLILWVQHNVKKYVLSEDCSTTHNLYIVYNILR